MNIKQEKKSLDLNMWFMWNDDVMFENEFLSEQIKKNMCFAFWHIRKILMD
jgi:hypothetical protein